MLDSGHIAGSAGTNRPRERDGVDACGLRLETWCWQLAQPTFPLRGKPPFLSHYVTVCFSSSNPQCVTVRNNEVTSSELELWSCGYRHACVSTCRALRTRPCHVIMYITAQALRRFPIARPPASRAQPADNNERYACACFQQVHTVQRY